MTYAERALDYLWAIAPDGATNGQLARGLGIRSQQTVYMLTRQLMSTGLVYGERSGAVWVFRAAEGLQPTLGVQPVRLDTSSRAARFETAARRVLAARYADPLLAGSVPGIRKRFEFVSADRRVVGSAPHFTRAGGLALPPAKYSIITEYVWLLEKTGAPRTFLVFGYDRDVPVRWLERYGGLAPAVTFYFLGDVGGLERLAGPER